MVRFVLVENTVNNEEQQVSRQWRWQQRKRRQGRCISCGNKAYGYWQCVRCRRLRRARLARARRRINEA